MQVLEARYSCNFLQEAVFQSSSDIAKAVARLDELIPGLKLTGGASGGAPCKHSVQTAQPHVNAAVGSLQSAFGTKGSISIAICGENHDYLQVPGPSPFGMPPQQMITALGLEAAMEMFLETKREAHGDAKFDEMVQKHERKVAAWQIAEQDRQRAEDLMRLADGGKAFGDPGLILMERKLKHDIGLKRREVVSEEELLPHCEGSATPEGRSIVFAAYIFLCVAAGNQTDNDQILVFIGARHADIIDYFEAFVSGSKTVTWLKSRPRNHVVIPSFVH